MSGAKPTNEMGRLLTLALLYAAMSALAGCAATRAVALSDASMDYVGVLTYDGPFSGVIVVENGPGGERFEGRFIVVDRTATTQVRSATVLPSSDGVAGVSGATGMASAGINAEGFWNARGTKGSRMECRLRVGRGGHGQGLCKLSDGKSLSIVL
jgi:hypothetical protein